MGRVLSHREALAWKVTRALDSYSFVAMVWEKLSVGKCIAFLRFCRDDLSNLGLVLEYRSCS